MSARTATSTTAQDGWIGTPELPGYRAGPVVARLGDFADRARDHLYFDLLLLDRRGRTADNDSGPCPAMPRQLHSDDRSRHVRLVAEFVRHAPDAAMSLAGAGPALAYIRTHGVGTACLVVAAQLLDAACSEDAVIRGLHHMLVLTLGEEEVDTLLQGLLAHLGPAPAAANEPPRRAWADPALDKVARIVRRVGKQRARRYLREALDCPLVPTPDMFGV